MVVWCCAWYVFSVLCCRSDRLELDDNQPHLLFQVTALDVHLLLSLPLNALELFSEFLIGYLLFLI